MGNPLCPDCQELSLKLAERDKRIEELEGLRALLEHDVKELRSERFKRRKKKPKEKDKAPGKKRGAPLGHQGRSSTGSEPGLPFTGRCGVGMLRLCVR